MALELNGTTGVSLVQDGVVTAADLASTLDLTGKTVTLPAGVGGKVLQIAQSVRTGTLSTSTSAWIDATDLSVTLTPSSASNKILVMGMMWTANRAGWNNAHARVVRNDTEIFLGDAAGNRARVVGFNNNANDSQCAVNTIYYLDSPNTTSSVTYKWQFRSGSSNAGNGIYVGRTYADGDSDDRPRLPASIIIMEISA